jgi:hypothetical protein
MQPAIDRRLGDERAYSFQFATVADSHDIPLG